MTITMECTDEAQVLLAHGGGGEMTQQLIAERIVPRLQNSLLDPLTDSAVLAVPSGRLAFTTDAFVVQPLEFPGGDIGRLAVCGTVNDLAVMGALPTALSLAMVIEEGLPLELMDRVLDSIAEAAREANVPIATGDTKTIERRGNDGMILTTAGVGMIRAGVNLGSERIAARDAIIITGTIADHGLAVMSAREDLGFDSQLRSDVAPLNGMIERMLAAGGNEVKFMRDPTRGGLAGVLADLAEQTGLSIAIDERAIPLSRVAQHTAELLGIDPLNTANEGKCVIVASEESAPAIVATCRAHPLGRDAAIIGGFQNVEPPLVELVTRAGGRRVVRRPYGEELPRIC